MDPGSSCESETASTVSSEESEVSSCVSDMADRVLQIPKKQKDAKKTSIDVAGGRPSCEQNKTTEEISKFKLKSTEHEPAVSRQRKSPAEPMFDDNDDEFGDLVIDIPNV